MLGRSHPFPETMRFSFGKAAPGCFAATCCGSSAMAVEEGCAATLQGRSHLFFEALRANPGDAFSGCSAAFVCCCTAFAAAALGTDSAMVPGNVPCDALSGRSHPGVETVRIGRRALPSSCFAAAACSSINSTWTRMVTVADINCSQLHARHVSYKSYPPERVFGGLPLMSCCSQQWLFCGFPQAISPGPGVACPNCKETTRADQRFCFFFQTTRLGW